MKNWLIFLAFVGLSSCTTTGLQPQYFGIEKAQVVPETPWVRTTYGWTIETIDGEKLPLQGPTKVFLSPGEHDLVVSYYHSYRTGDYIHTEFSKAIQLPKYNFELGKSYIVYDLLSPDMVSTGFFKPGISPFINNFLGERTYQNAEISDQAFGNPLFFPDNLTLTDFKDDLIRQYQVPSGKKTEKKFAVKKISASLPQKDEIYIGDESPAIYLYSYPDLQILKTQSVPDKVRKFTKGAGRLIGQIDQELYVWDSASLDLVSKIPFTKNILDFQILTKSNEIVVVLDGSMEVRGLDKSNSTLRSVPMNSKMRSFSINPAEDSIVIVSDDRKGTVYSVSDLKGVPISSLIGKKFEKRELGWATYSSNGRYLIIGAWLVPSFVPSADVFLMDLQKTDDKGVILWGGNMGEYLKINVSSGMYSIIDGGVLSDDGGALAITVGYGNAFGGVMFNKVRIYDLTNPEPKYYR